MIARLFKNPSTAIDLMGLEVLLFQIADSKVFDIVRANSLIPALKQQDYQVLHLKLYPSEFQRPRRLLPKDHGPCPIYDRC